MAETPEQNDYMFPTLDDAQIERVAAFGSRLAAQPGQLLFDQGSDNGCGHGFCVGPQVPFVCVRNRDFGASFAYSYRPDIDESSAQGRSPAK